MFNGCKVNKEIADNNNFKIKERETFRIMFYNVENLFDTINDPATNDEEFLPEGNYHWNSYRYYDKQQKLSKVIIALGEWQLPDMIGLAEIENTLVLNDLINLTPIKSGNYAIIHKESPDLRGIDVALLYRKKSFKPIYYEFLQIKNPEEPGFKTREILYTNGIVKKDTLHIFVNHWPSRRGGALESEGNRILTAKVLKNKIDSIFNINSNAYIVIVGDFNDEPDNESITNILGAKGDTLAENLQLFNLSYRFKYSGTGSYKYNQEWNIIDQIIVSKAFLKENSSLYMYFNSAQIFRQEWMMEDDSKYPGKKPFRTFSGPRYLGGYSDHLPVYTDIRFR